MSWYFEFDYNSIAIWPIHDVICILCYILLVSAFALRSSSVLIFHLILREYHFFMATVWTLDVYQNWLKITILFFINCYLIFYQLLFFINWLKITIPSDIKHLQLCCLFPFFVFCMWEHACVLLWRSSLVEDYRKKCETGTYSPKWRVAAYAWQWASFTAQFMQTWNALFATLARTFIFMSVIILMTNIYHLLCEIE